MTLANLRPPIAVASVAAITPLVVDRSGWFVAVQARWAFLSVAALVSGGALLWAAVRDAGRDDVWWRRVPGVAWWSALVLVAAVSALGSGAARVSLLGTADRRAGAAMWLVHGVLFVGAAAFVRKRSGLRTVVRGISVAAVVVTAAAAAERLGWSVLGTVGSPARPGATLGNADFLGAFAALAFPAALGAAAHRAERGAWRLLHAVAVTGAVFCLVASGTRGAWVGVVVAGVVAAEWVARRVDGGRRRVGLVLAAVVVGLVGVGLWSGVGDRVSAVTSGTAAGRVATWDVTASVIGERPILGWGPEGFAAGFGRSVDDSWERSYSRRLVPDRAHDGLLDVAASMGLIGLAVYLGTLAAVGRGVMRSVRTGPASPVLLGASAALVAYLVQQVFLFQLADVDAVAWLLAGCLVGCGASAPRAVARSGARARSSARSGAARAAVVVATAAAVATVCVTAVVAVRGVAADRAARTAVDLAGADPAAAVAAARRAVVADPQTMYALVLADASLADGSTAAVERARSTLAVVRSASFDDGRLTLARSRLARSLGTTEALDVSRAEVESLVTVDVARSDGWAELGELDLALGDATGATAMFERAVRLAPGRVAWRTRWATAAERAGDREAARRVLVDVDPRDLGPDGRALQERLGTTAAVDAR